MSCIWKLSACTVLALAALVASPAVSEAGFVDTFSYPNGELGTQGGWASVASVTEIVNGELRLSGANNANAATHGLSPINGTFYFSFNFRFSGVIDNNDFFALWFNSDSGPNIGLKGNQENGVGPKDFFIRLSAAEAVTYDVNAQVGVDYLIVGKLEKVGSTYESMTLWVNPTSESSTFVTATSIPPGPTSVTQLGMRIANLDSGDSVFIDNLQIGDSFAAVTVPAPPGAVLMAIGAFGLIGGRVLRRRKPAVAA
jgi:hypothetical protein